MAQWRSEVRPPAGARWRRRGARYTGRTARWGFVLSACWALVACGGSGDDGGGQTVQPNPTPDACEIQWQANQETAMSAPGSVYRVYYSESAGVVMTDPFVEVPYTQTTLGVSSTGGTPYTCADHFAITAVPADTTFPPSPLSAEVGF